MKRVQKDVVVEYYGVGGSGPDPNTSWWRSWCGRQHKLVGTEIIVSSPMQPKPPDGIRMCVLLLRVHLVRLYYFRDYPLHHHVCGLSFYYSSASTERGEEQ